MCKKNNQKPAEISVKQNALDKSRTWKPEVKTDFHSQNIKD